MSSADDRREGARHGRGIAWPLRIDADGRLARTAGDANVREHVRLILLTERGERQGVPEFGAGLGQFLFEPNTVSTHQMIRGRIEQALARWEPRIRVSGVEVIEDPQDALAARVTVHYRLVADDRRERVTLSLNLGAR
jgi:uncharacterized protein